jgi:hypothetical protein
MMKKIDWQDWKRRILATAPYLLALLLPGGSLVAAALWIYRGRQRGA